MDNAISTRDINTIPTKEPERRISKAEQARINGAKSRGPKTKEGKARSSQNARKHGLTASVLQVDKADEEAFNQLRQGLANSLRPQNRAEELVIDNIARITWTLKQSDRMEAEVIYKIRRKRKKIGEAFRQNAHELMLLSTYQWRLERCLHKLLEKLRKLRKDAIDPTRNPTSIGTARRDFKSPENRKTPGKEKYNNEPTF